MAEQEQEKEKKIRGVLERWDPKPEKHPDLVAILIRPEGSQQGEGEWFTSFEAIEPPALGSRVEAQYQVKGINRNITALKVLQEQNPAPSPNRPGRRADNIDARTALMVAQDYAATQEKEITAKVLLELADRFYGWLEQKARANQADGGGPHGHG